MLISQYGQFLGTLFAARVTPLFWGVHGIGKTSSLDAYAKENGHRLFNLRLGNMSDAGDLLGLGDFVTDSAGQKVATKFFAPNWQRELFQWAEANPSKLAIIHLDEITRVPKFLQNPVLQIALENRLHETQFPDNVRVVASGNPPTKNYDGVVATRDMAYWDRFCHIKVEASADDWLNYARAKGLNSDVRGFIQEHPHLLLPDTETFSIDTYVNASPRSYEAAAKLYEMNASSEMIYGLLGQKRGQMFYQWVKDNKEKTVQLEDLLKYSKATRDRVLKMVENDRRAELASLSMQLTDHFKKMSEAKETADAKMTKACAGYLMDLPEDMMIALCFNLIREISICVQIDKDGKHPEVYKRVEEIIKSGKVDVKSLQKSESAA